MTPALTSNEAEVIYKVLVRTWIPNGPDGRVFEDAVKKLEVMANQPKKENP